MNLRKEKNCGAAAGGAKAGQTAAGRVKGRRIAADSERIRRMCLSGVFAAVIFVFTAYFHIPSHTGYTHVGDGFLFLAACLLPAPYAAFAGSAGAVLADCLSGYALWAPGTLAIKAVTALFFSGKSARIVCARNLLALLPSWAVCIGGYYLYEALITGNFIAPLAGIPGYVTQSALSTVLFVLLGSIFDKMKIKEMLP